ncbi:MAG: hypothetical protein ACREEB_00380 [Caulobacteraceae bacterium]
MTKNSRTEDHPPEKLTGKTIAAAAALINKYLDRFLFGMEVVAPRDAEHCFSIGRQMVGCHEPPAGCAGEAKRVVARNATAVR